MWKPDIFPFLFWTMSLKLSSCLASTLSSISQNFLNSRGVPLSDLIFKFTICMQQDFSIGVFGETGLDIFPCLWVHQICDWSLDPLMLDPLMLNRPSPSLLKSPMVNFLVYEILQHFFKTLWQAMSCNSLRHKFFSEKPQSNVLFFEDSGF